MIKAIEYKDNGVHLSFHGIITSKEVMDANTKIINHHGFKSYNYTLWLFESVEDFIISANEIRLIAEQDKRASEENPKIKVAIVSSSPLTFGFGRMWESFYGDGPWETMVFYNLDEAEEWINS